MIFAPDHVGDFHFEIVDHVDEMKNPRAVWTPDRHVGVRGGIAEIEIDSSGYEIVHDDVLAWRPKPQRPVVFEYVTGVLKFVQVTLVEFCAFALQIRTELAAAARPLIPIHPIPFLRRWRPSLPRCCASCRCLRYAARISLRDASRRAS